MTAPSTLTPAVPTVRERPAGVRERRRERRRLVEQDRRAQRQAELFVIRALLADAGGLVDAGWVQHCWFTADDDQGGRRRIGPQNLHELSGRSVVEVCLVGAIIQAGGGVARAGSQPVHRALDLTWATLYNQPAGWCPPPPVRLAHVHDLTRWNDSGQRAPQDVSSLLVTASARARELAG